MMLKKMMMFRRGVSIASNFTRRARAPSSSSPPLLYCFSSSSPFSNASSAASDPGTTSVETDEDLFMTNPRPAFLNESTPSVLQPNVVIYDGVCNLCHKGVKWLIKVDKEKNIKFCCLQSRAAEPYLRYCGVDREDVLRRFIFVEGLDSCYEASTAALKIASYLPRPYSALSSLLIIPTPLRDAVYDYVAENRYKWFGRDKDCIVMREQDLLDRFIDREEILERSQSEM